MIVLAEEVKTIPESPRNYLESNHSGTITFSHPRVQELDIRPLPY